MDAEDFVHRVERKVRRKGRPVVTYSVSKKCDASPRAARKLEEAGINKVYEYEGGTRAWKEAGNEVQRA